MSKILTIIISGKPKSGKTSPAQYLQRCLHLINVEAVIDDEPLNPGVLDVMARLAHETLNKAVVTSKVHNKTKE